MGSFIEQYNYDKVNPFKTDYEGMLRGLQIKESYWKQGVQRVKTAYEQAAGLNLTGDIAKNRLSVFMQDADKQLKKILATDVSMSENAAAGVKLYKPLYQDAEIMDNHKITSHYDTVLNDINSYRTKNNGKEYNDYNAQYALLGVNDFKEAMKRGDSAKEYLQTKELKSYIPYTDYTTNFKDALKQCPENVAMNPLYKDSKGRAIEGYIDQSVVSSKTPSQIAGCVSSFLDSKDMRQMQIEAAVKFKGQESLLGQEYLQMHSGIIPSNNKQILDLSLKLKTEPNSDNQRNIQSQINILKAQNKEIENFSLQADKGDFSFVTGQNYETIAGSVYTNKLMERFGNSFAYNKVNPDISVDPNFVMRKNNEFKEHMAYVDFNIQERLENQKQLGKEKIESIKSQAELEKLFINGDGKITKDENGQYKITESSGINGFSKAEDENTQYIEHIEDDIKTSTQAINNLNNDVISQLQSFTDGGKLTKDNVYEHAVNIQDIYEGMSIKLNKKDISKEDRQFYYDFINNPKNREEYNVASDYLGQVRNEKSKLTTAQTLKTGIDLALVGTKGLKTLSPKSQNFLNNLPNGELKLELVSEDNPNLDNLNPFRNNEYVSLSDEEAKKLMSVRKATTKDGKIIELTEKGFNSFEKFMDVTINGEKKKIPFSIGDRKLFDNGLFDVFQESYNVREDNSKTLDEVLSNKKLRENKVNLVTSLTPDQKELRQVIYNNVSNNGVLGAKGETKDSNIKLEDVKFGYSKYDGKVTFTLPVSLSNIDEEVLTNKLKRNVTKIKGSDNEYQIDSPEFLDPAMQRNNQFQNDFMVQLELQKHNSPTKQYPTTMNMADLFVPGFKNLKAIKISSKDHPDETDYKFSVDIRNQETGIYETHPTRLTYQQLQDLIKARLKK